MTKYILDANHISEAIRPVSNVRERIHLARRKGNRFGTCVPVLCELEAGWQATKSYLESRRALERLFRQVAVWPMEKEIAQIFGELFQEAKAKGRVLSQVDLMLAAFARMGKLTILTTDKDFTVFPDISTENWLA